MYAKQTFFLLAPMQAFKAESGTENQRGEISAPPSLYWRQNRGLGCVTWPWMCLLLSHMASSNAYKCHYDAGICILSKSEWIQTIQISCNMLMFVYLFRSLKTGSPVAQACLKLTVQPTVILISWSACFCFPSVGSPDLRPQNSTEELPMGRDSPVSPHISPPPQGFWAE